MAISRYLQSRIFESLLSHEARPYAVGLTVISILPTGWPPAVMSKNTTGS